MNKNMISPVKLLSGQISQDECFHPVVTRWLFEGEDNRDEIYSCAICDERFNKCYTTKELCEDPCIIYTFAFGFQKTLLTKEYIKIMCKKYITEDEINIVKLIKMVEEDIDKEHSQYTKEKLKEYREDKDFIIVKL